MLRSDKLKIILITILALFGTIPVFAQEEVIVNYEPSSLPVLNDQLRRTVRRVQALEGGLDLSSSTLTGILPTTKGGTGLNAGLAPADSLLMFTATGSMEVIEGGGSTTTFLRGDGTFAVPDYPPDPGIILLTTVSGTAVNTGDIALEADKEYLVTFTFYADDSTANTIELNFNSDGSGYVANAREAELDGTPTETIADGGAIEIADIPASDGWAQGKIYISTYDNAPSGTKATVHADLIFKDDSEAGDPLTDKSIKGYYSDTAVTSFEFLSVNDFTYLIRVYEYTQ